MAAATPKPTPKPSLLSVNKQAQQAAEKPGAAAPAKEPVSKASADKAAIQKRAEERNRVPIQFRDGFKHFFFTPTGVLKVLRLILLVAALSVFLTADAHESYIAITVLEICIVLFFILVYVLTLHHLLLCLDWHLFDLINSFITSVFLLVVAASAIKEQQRKQLFFTGGMLCLIAALLCIIDAILVTRGMRNKLKKLLGFKVETQQVRVVKEIPEKGATKVLSRTVITSSTPAAPTQPPGPAPAPTQPPGSAPTKAVSRAPSPTSMAPPRAPTKSTKRPSTRT
ncbi:chemokine-like factor isoform X2 [Erinaceus europaeus]|uniref:Chemokine-like factor isoform X2 n=1 Tax=Erinaceus europaeus TaxID=9365 RepID=A0A1S2ZDT4_ERIEU|nr:chemokine-like factor isoform X2 [Erinaceus europaeus]